MMRLRTWSLRRRLVATVTLVAVAALLAVDIATYRSLQQSLLDRLEAQVAQIAQQRPPGEDPAERPGRPGQPPAAQRPTPAGTWMAVFTPNADGTYGDPFNEVVAGVTTIDRERDIPDIEVTEELLRELRAAPAEFQSADGSTTFLVQSRGLRDGDAMLVAIPMTEYYATLDRLRNIELVVSLVAMIGIVLLALVTVRAGLRPLEAITGAATEITHDAATARIGRRVPVDAAASSEVGRLASSLNEMLDSLDNAFAAQHAAQERLRSFVSDASHELRTPLTSIQGFAELARTRAKDMTDDERDTALLRVEQEASHLTGLVEDLLMLSRLDEGVPLHPQRVDIAQIAATSVDAARVIEPSRTVDFDSSGPVVIDADPTRVRQIVDNLLANARTHAGDDAAVTVRVEPSAAGGARIVVVDDGVGMDPADLARATDRFWRADTARTRATGGSGLGLAMVQSLVDAHGGSVVLASGEGGTGLRVVVELPRN